MVDIDRRILGYALLFSVPPGVGVAGFLAVGSRGETLPPVALLAGLVTAGSLFALVVAGAGRGSPETEPR